MQLNRNIELSTSVLLICQCLTIYGQYQNFGDGYRADMTFDDHNDRFDVADIIGEQNENFHDLPEAYDEMGGRRLLKRLKKHSRRLEDFAYHDKLESNEYGDIDGKIAKENYERSLAKFQSPKSRRSAVFNKLNDFIRLRNGNNILKLLKSLTRRIGKDNKRSKKTRRSQNEEQNLEQTLLNYGMPVNMKVSGFIPLT